MKGTVTTIATAAASVVVSFLCFVFLAVCCVPPRYNKTVSNNNQMSLLWRQTRQIPMWVVLWMSHTHTDNHTHRGILWVVGVRIDICHKSNRYIVYTVSLSLSTQHNCSPSLSIYISFSFCPSLAHTSTYLFHLPNRIIGRGCHGVSRLFPLDTPITRTARSCEIIIELTTT